MALHHDLSPGRVLIVGASGFVGRRLIPQLAKKNVKLRLPVRDLVKAGPLLLRGADIEVAQGDLAAHAGLAEALRGIQGAYSLVHSMGGRTVFRNEGYAEKDRIAAKNFLAAEEAECLKRIICLGGPGDASDDLGRAETGRILYSGTPKATILRAAAIIWVLAALLAGCGNSYYQGPVTGHFNGKQFDNPWAPMPDRFGDFLKWRFTGDRGPWPESVAVTAAQPPERVMGSDLRVTYVGHATVLLQTQGVNILTDPIWSERASPVSFAGPKRVAAPGVRFEDLPPVDVVLVSHNHYDHMDMTTLKRLYQAFNPLVLTPLGNDSIIHASIPKMRVMALDWGGSFDLKPGIRFRLEPMQHWSARGLFDRREALWGAFVIEAPGGPIYFLADAGYAKNLSEDFVAGYGTPRFSLLPIAAYEPEWFMQYAHMTPAQAVDTFTDLGQSCAMGTQHEVFPLADEAYAAPREALTKALQAKGISPERFMLPAVGEWFMVPPI